jgi:uncharacterized protein (DUF433 family)
LIAATSYSRVLFDSLLFNRYELHKIYRSNAEVMLGKPVVKGTRVSVVLILKKLSEGATIQDLTVAYPDLSETSIKAVLAYAYDVIANETVIAVA